MEVKDHIIEQEMIELGLNQDMEVKDQAIVREIKINLEVIIMIEANQKHIIKVDQEELVLVEETQKNLTEIIVIKEDKIVFPITDPKKK